MTPPRLTKHRSTPPVDEPRRTRNRTSATKHCRAHVDGDSTRRRGWRRPSSGSSLNGRSGGRRSHHRGRSPLQDHRSHNAIWSFRRAFADVGIVGLSCGDCGLDSGIVHTDGSLDVVLLGATVLGATSIGVQRIATVSEVEAKQFAITCIVGQLWVYGALNGGTRMSGRVGSESLLGDSWRGSRCDRIRRGPCGRCSPRRRGIRGSHQPLEEL